MRQANFKRSTKLSYVAGEDIVKVLSEGRMLSISGIAAGIRKMFEQRYSALIGKARCCTVADHDEAYL